jgi:hypothetical protein
MSKNIIVGILVAILVIGGGFYLLKNKPAEPVTPTTNTNTNTTPPDNTATTPPVTVPPLTLGTPVVETSSQVGVSNSTALVTGQVKPNGVPTTYCFDYGEKFISL